MPRGSARSPLRRLLLILALSNCALALLIAAIPMVARAQEPSLVEGFIAAVNTKDKAQIEAFIAKHWDNAMPAADRAGRVMNIANQGAPFKFVRMVSSTPRALKAIVKDKEGMDLGWILNLDPAGKIQTIMLGDPEELDAPPPKDYRGWTSLAALTESIRNDTDSPGMSVAVYRDGRIDQAVAGFREAGKTDPVKITDVFMIGSIGKPITSTLIGLLIERGKLDWSTTLAQALPDIPMKDVYKAVTLEQVMHHRGGIPQDMGFRKPEVDRILQGATEPMKMRENYVRDVLSRDPIAGPGEKFAYSNAGFTLLGVIAERTMKKPYEELVKDMIFKPLGLKNSYTAGDTLPEERPSGHVRAGQGSPSEGAPKWNPVNFKGPLESMMAPAGGGYFMTSDDLVKFAIAHLKGLRGEDDLLKASTVKRLHQGIAERPGDKMQYACGWGIRSAEGIEESHGHNGSNGTQIAEMMIFPKAGVVAVAFTNRGGESQPSPSLQAVTAIAQRYAPAK